MRSVHRTAARGPTVVLVHGGWHGAWCWDRLRPWLAGAGAHVLAPELPAHGADRTPIAALTPHSYVDRIADLVGTQSGPVILAGHSSGGMIISAVAGRAPDRVAALVYVSAFLLPAGRTPPEVMRDDRESLLPSSLIADEQGQTTHLRREDAWRVFYEDCNDEDAAWALDRLQPEPRVPRSTAAEETSSSTFLSVPRFYVECTKDRALGPRTQRAMHEALPCRRVFSLPTGHSPFVAAPQLLAECLLAVRAAAG
jgi:pimeloyl-ACP methyl ester carboxylesterase